MAGGFLRENADSIVNIIRDFYNNNRVKGGLILLVAIALYASITLLSKQMKLYPGNLETDPVTIHETRINQLKEDLRPHASVGYVTTVENEKIFTSERQFYNVEYLAQYVLTQYTLAPVIVYNSPDHPLVVGNFISGPPDRQFLRQKNLTPLKDFGDGLVLYKNENIK